MPRRDVAIEGAAIGLHRAGTGAVERHVGNVKAHRGLIIAIEPDARRAWSHGRARSGGRGDRKSTRLNSSHRCISYAVFCLKKKKQTIIFVVAVWRFMPKIKQYRYTNDSEKILQDLNATNKYQHPDPAYY